MRVVGWWEGDTHKNVCIYIYIYELCDVQMRVYTAEGGAVLHEFYNLRTILPVLLERSVPPF